MTPNRLALGLALVFVAVMAAAAWAEEPQEGKVLAVGSDSITILDKVEGDNDMYLVDAATKITRAGKPAKLGDVQVGDRVKIIVGRPEKGKMVAKEIRRCRRNDVGSQVSRSQFQVGMETGNRGLASRGIDA